jgi:hypothetical protein
VELAKDWRSDRILRRLEAMLVVLDKSAMFLLSGTGDLIEPDDGIVAIGSGGPYAQAAAKALALQTGCAGDRRKAMAVPPRSASIQTPTSCSKNCRVLGCSAGLPAQATPTSADTLTPGQMVAERTKA